jgi:hypothetical protein
MKTTEIVIINSIKDITNTLEARIQVLVNEFMKLEKELDIELTVAETDINEIKSPAAMDKLNQMTDIFIELKPIERLIRYKYPEFNKIFDQLSVIEAERTYGKFFSFLMCLPGRKRSYQKKNQFIQRSLIGTSSVE